MKKVEEKLEFTAVVIVLSDKGSKGERKDLSGPKAKEILEQNGYRVNKCILLPDEPELLKSELIRLTDEVKIDLIITSGGTGFSLRDNTPEATLAVADRNAPGIAEAIRAESLKITGHAMLSRGVSVIRKQTLIINLPGSHKAVKESLEYILKYIDHGLKVLKGSAFDCAKEEKK
ncbi:MAG: MogA/MoaB family molybdenum cofactor biosynthesis protein [Candidatus Riflebacteria bacterium]|nr:MogA/MoaB family molybdenum cofactor biosynthesis protein [Candidatus Riflebacteria bacterium]